MHDVRMPYTLRTRIQHVHDVHILSYTHLYASSIRTAHRLRVIPLGITTTCVLLLVFGMYGIPFRFSRKAKQR